MKASFTSAQAVLCRIGAIYTFVSLVAFCIAVVPASAQPWNIEVEVGTEQLFENGYSIAGTSDGGAIAIGPAFLSTGEGRISLVRFDPHGSIVWTRTYTAFAYTAPNEMNEFSIKVTADQQFIWTTSISYLSVGTRDVIVGRTDQLGNPIWTTIFGSIEYDDFGASVIEVADGFIVTGTSCNWPASDSCDVLLFKLNPGGTVLWGYRYDFQGMEIGRCVREDAAGNLVIVGESLSYLHISPPYGYGFMLKTSSGGIVQWAGHYGKDAAGTGFSTVEVGANDDYYACGFSQTIGGIRGGYITQVNQSSGALTNANTYVYHGDYEGFWYIAPSWNSDNFVLTGEVTDTLISPTVLRTIAMEVGPGLGDPVWTRLYGDRINHTVGHCITQAQRHASPPTNSDGGYWIFGSRVRTPGDQMYVIRTDSLSGATSCSECVTLDVGANPTDSLLQTTRIVYNTSGPYDMGHEVVLQDSVICAGTFAVPDTCQSDPPECADDCYWTLEGNAGTNPADNYLGTSDNTALSIRTNATERMHIEADGDIGIGTQTPGRRVEIFTTNPSAPQLRLSDHVDAFDLWGGFDFHIREVASGNTRLFVEGVSGNVGIGTTNPNWLLEVNGSAAKPGSNVWTISSDAQLKTDIAPYNDGLDMLRRIEPVWFRYNGLGGLPTDERYVGILAQEMREVAPYTVGTRPMKLRESDEQDSETLTFDGNALTYMTINAVKELDARIAEMESLRTENTELRASIEDLRMMVYDIQTACCAAGAKNTLETPGVPETGERARLYQNAPNPFHEITRIAYYLPSGIRSAHVIVRDEIGREALRLPLSQTGSGSVEVHAGSLSAGAYQYSLVVDGATVDTRRMILTR